jgi:hypothetical protein
LLPSGPGGVRRFSLRGAQPSTPSHEAHSTRPALERGFDPAEADCGLQGTANSPSSTATPRSSNEWRRGWDLNPRHRGSPRARHFQCRTFGRSVTPPEKELAEGRGFEPPRDLLGPYPISSRTPSTGLGHPSASLFRPLRSSHPHSLAAPVHDRALSLPQRRHDVKRRSRKRACSRKVPCASLKVT